MSCFVLARGGGGRAGGLSRSSQRENVLLDRFFCNLWPAPIYIDCVGPLFFCVVEKSDNLRGSSGVSHKLHLAAAQVRGMMRCSQEQGSTKNNGKQKTHPLLLNVFLCTAKLQNISGSSTTPSNYYNSTVETRVFYAAIFDGKTKALCKTRQRLLYFVSYADMFIAYQDAFLGMTTTPST